MQPAPAVVDTENFPVPSNHPPIFPATSSTSVAPPQHSAALPVNSPQPSQLELMQQMEYAGEVDETFQDSVETNDRSSESVGMDAPFNAASRNNSVAEDVDIEERKMPSELGREEMAVTMPTEVSGKAVESGYSSEERERNAALESKVNINPEKGPVKGGLCFRLYFEEKLPKSMDYGWALFGNNQPVKVWKTSQDDCLYGDKIPPGTGPGLVVVTVLTQSNSGLGRTLFTYFDEEVQWLEQIVRNKKLQGKFFKKLYKQCEGDESDESDVKRRKQHTGNSGSPKQGVLQNSVNVLQCLVYTAARIGAEDFIRMLFSSSAGRIVFKTYKNNSPLPEEIAVANSRFEVAAYLRAITERFSEENERSQTPSEIDWLELVRAAEDSDLKTSPLEKSREEQMEEDNSDKEYFADAETSSSASEKERSVSEGPGEKFSEEQMEKDNSDKEYLADTEKSFSDSEKEISVSEVTRHEAMDTLDEVLQLLRC